MPTINASRRNFLKKASLAGFVSAGLLNTDLFANAAFANLQKESGLIFLFQGDSITDGNRGRNNDPNHILGHGYAFSIASGVGASFPEKNIVFYNRGISGNKITDLAARWQTDTLDLKPDLLSILIGVNDANSVISQRDVVTVEKYEEIYRSLLQQTRSALPNCLLVLCEPFILPVGKLKENWDAWNEDIQKRQQVVSRLAKEYNAVFVPFQKIFKEALGRTVESYWIWDGIHPTYSGHALMTDEWLKQVSKRISFLGKLRY